ncbi:MAG: HD-GYP domain-containing protein [Planctomycetota bacterium]|nr:MAG: HD-GYP domain-containing protein [Planctomycetota bacterium]
MNEATAFNPALLDASNSLRERARALRLWIIRCDAEGRVLPDPGEARTTEERLLASLLTSGYVRHHLRDAGSRWATQDMAEPVELIQGVWAIPIPEMHRRKRVGYCVAFALTPEALEGEQFQAACQSARLDAQATREACEAYATHRPMEIARLALLLNWSYAERQEMEAQEASIIELSGQLAESYEEISLLYTLGGAMRELVRPGKFIQLMCEQLRETLGFAWIAVRFLSTGKRVGQLAGMCQVSGHVALERQELARAIDAVLERMDDATPFVVEPGDRAAGGRFEAEALVQPLMRDGALIGAIVAGEKRVDSAGVSSIDMKLLDAASAYLLVLIENTALYDEQRAMFLGTLEALTAAIDAKDPYTRGHSQRVAHLSMRLAMAMGLDEHTVERLRIAGLVHDIGKIGVPEAVLQKPGRLTDEEFRLIKLHPEIGQRILKDIPQMEDVLPAVLHHHERWDGGGYPEGLKREQIPLYARVVALADAFDAMRSTRTYRKSKRRSDVLDEIRRNAGVQFDPDLVDVFLKLDFSRYEEMIRRHLNAVEDALSVQGKAA